MPTAAFPDPVLTANIYFSGQLDRLIEEAVAPFWSALRAAPGGAEYFLWLLRYDLLGEHLKIRIHGPAERLGELRERLAAAVGPLLEPGTAAAPGGGAGQRSPAIARWRRPPIDAEDAAKAPPADRQLIFTRYRRSPVSLGDRPFLDDDRYCALLAATLAAGCEEVLSAAGGPPGDRLGERRQVTLFLLLIAGLALLPGGRGDYLAYHRDWLIRLPLLKLNGSRTQGEEIQGRFETIAVRRAGQREFLAGLAQGAWQPPDAGAAAATPFTWALAELLAELPRFAALPAARVDPFAAGPAEELVFPVLFKVFHGLANQLGIGRFDEAFAHHLLLRAVEPQNERAGSFRLLPAGAAGQPAGEPA
jgi:hypothetical protein